MASWRQPNLRLRDALAEAGWTGQQLAAAVNSAGAEAGLTLSYDRTAVAHWLSGTRPRPPVPRLLAEAFSRQLGRTVTPAELGLVPVGPGDAASDLVGADVVAALTGLHAAGKLQAAVAPAYRLAALEIPAWPGAGAVTAPRRRPEPRGIGVADAEAAEYQLGALAAGDAALGGGRVRRATAAYLAADLAPKLRADMPPTIRRRMFAAGTQLAYLCGFTCFDDELHGLGQGYYRIALQLAAENGDRASYAMTLRALSVQANALSHHQHARRLAEAAADSIRHLEPDRQAFVHGQLAVAQAAEGDRTAALASLTVAEQRLDQATSAAPVGAYHVASLAHQRAAVLNLLGDRDAAIAALGFSVLQRPSGERRSRAITLAFLADLQLSVGRLEEAVRTWDRFLDDYPLLRSGRVTTALRGLRARMRPFSKNAAARALLQRAAETARGW